LAIAASALLLAAPAEAGTLVAPSVRQEGTKFVDSSASVVTLRGFDVPSGNSPNLWRKAFDLGANFVRIPIYWEEIEPTKPVNGVHTWNTTFLSHLDSEIAYFQSKNVQVLIDLHQVDWSSYFRPERSRGIPRWFYSNGRFPATEDGLADAKAAWWTTEKTKSLAAYRPYAAMIVKRYRSYPNVVGYELFNEAQPGKLGYTANATKLIIAWQASILQTMRADDPLRTVFFTPRQGGLLGLLNADLTPFGSLDNLALDLHTYFNGTPGSGYSDDGEAWYPSWEATHNQNFTSYMGTYQAQEETFLVPFQRAQELGLPLVVGEWGVKNADTGGLEYQDQMLRVFQKFGAGWTRWDLSSNPNMGLLDSSGGYRPLALQLKQALTAPSPAVTTRPSSSGAPRIWGAAREGKRLVALPGPWLGTPPFDFTYLWKRCESDGTGCVNIPGATTPTYLVATADLGSKLKFKVTASNSAGSASALSTLAGPILPDPPAILAYPTVSGSTVVGQLLTANPGQWSGSQPIAFSYRWQRCSSLGKNCVNILGAAATNATYRLVSGDATRTVRVKVTATNTAGAVNETSEPTGVITR
jgi:hypothetical protein